MNLSFHRGPKHTAQPFWLRMFALFCLGLIVVGSTAQVCHAHVDAFEASLLQVHAAGPVHATADGFPKSATSDSDSNSAVSCPLCVAMHSALPMAQSFPQVVMQTMATVTPDADGIARKFSWRFTMASRPPPAQRTHA